MRGLLLHRSFGCPIQQLIYSEGPDQTVSQVETNAELSDILEFCSEGTFSLSLSFIMGKIGTLKGRYCQRVANKEEPHKPINII